MHFIWKRKMEFENFIRGIASNKIKPFGGLYALITVVESYFELISRVLMDKIGLSKADLKRKENNQENLTKDLLNEGSIDEVTNEIFHEVRKIRNDLVHDVLYKPDLRRLQEFVKTCFNSELDPAEIQMCLLSEEKLEQIFCNKITEAYCYVSNKHNKQVEMKLAEYIERS